MSTSTGPAMTMLETAPSLRERVYAALEQSIIDGTLKPGIHLREDEIARQLGVSRNPVREAFQSLVHHGYADHFPGKGVYVHTPTRTEVEDVFDTRRVLESECARLAAERITPERLAELEDLLGEGSAAIESGEPIALLLLNERFHRVIAEAAGNTVMNSMIDSLQRRIRWYFAGVVVARAPDSWEQHQQLVEALAAHDGARAARIMSDHVSATRVTIERSLAALAEPARQ